MNKKPRVIKKYPNRRLYDTVLSRYITLSDVRELVIHSVEFEIIDTQSKKDLTRNILLQIIMEQEAGGRPLFTNDILSRMIRYYGDSMQTAFTAYLDNSIDFFAEQQKQMQDQVSGTFDVNPMQAMTEIMQKNIGLWRDMQERVVRQGSTADSENKKNPQEQVDNPTSVG